MSKKPNLRTPEEKKSILEKIDTARKNGTPFKDAVKAGGITHFQYYNWKSVFKTKKRRTSTQLVTIPLPNDDAPLLLFMGKSKDISHALDRLAEINRSR